MSADGSEVGAVQIVDNVREGLVFACHQGWFAGADSTLTATETEHLLAISKLASLEDIELAYEVIDRVLKLAGRFTAAEILCKQLHRGLPSRGDTAGRLQQVLAGEGKVCIYEDYTWVDAAVVDMAGCAFKAVLTDKRSSPETNGYIFCAIHNLLMRLPHHARQLWELVGDSAREASESGNVKECQVGGGDALILMASASIWALEQTTAAVKGGNLHPNDDDKGLYTLVNGVRDYSLYQCSEKEDSGCWMFLHKEVKRSTLGIALCGCCEPPVPNILCNFRTSQKESLIAEGLTERADVASVLLQEVVKSGQTEILEKVAEGAVQSARLALNQISKLRKWGKLPSTVKKKIGPHARKLLVTALEALFTRPGCERVQSKMLAEEAIAALVTDLPIEAKMNSTFSSGIPPRIDDTNAFAVYFTARALLFIGQHEEANRLAALLLVVQPLFGTVNGNRVPREDIDIDGWKEKGRSLVARIATASPTEFTAACATRQPQRPTLAPELDVYSDLVSRWSWRSVGDQSVNTFDYYSKHVEIIERLHACVFWLRDSVILYDYEAGECLHWFDGTSQCVRWRSFDVSVGHQGRTYLVFFGERARQARTIVLLDCLKKGGRTNLMTATMDTSSFFPVLAAFSPAPNKGMSQLLHDSLLPWYLDSLDRYLQCEKVAFKTWERQSSGKAPGWALAIGGTPKEPYDITVFLTDEKAGHNHKAATAAEQEHFLNILLLGPVAFPLLLADEFMGKEVGDLSRRLGIDVGIEKALRKVASKFRARKVSLMGHAHKIVGVEFCSSNDRLVATSSGGNCDENVVKVWNYESGQCIFTTRDFGTQVLHMALTNGLLFATSVSGYPRPNSLSNDKVFVFNCGWSDRDDVGQILAELPNNGSTSVTSMMSVSSHPTVVVAYKDGGISLYKYPLPPLPTDELSSLSSQLSFSVSHERRINFTGRPLVSLSVGRLGEGFFAGATPWLYWSSFGESAAMTPGGEKFLAPTSEKMNCAHCGLFKGHTQSKKCGGCENARFCGPECSKAGWKSHKAVCKARQSANKKKGGEASEN